MSKEKEDESGERRSRGESMKSTEDDRVKQSRLGGSAQPKQTEAESWSQLKFPRKIAELPRLGGRRNYVAGDIIL